MPVLKSRSIHKILIRGANWVGDAAMTTPVIRAIRKNFPQARISLLVKPWVAPLFDGNPFIDQVVVYQGQDRHKGLAGLWRLGRDLRRQGFDAAFLMQNAFEAAFLAWLAGIPIRIGYNTDGRTLLLRPALQRPKRFRRMHMIDYYLEILKRAGLDDDGRQMDLRITAQETRQARAVLSQHQVGPNQLLIGMSPGAEGGLAKRWLPDRYAHLGRRLVAATGCRLILFGAPADAELGRRIQTSIGSSSCINQCGRTTLRQAMALMACCDAFITNDSGLMHVAAALDIAQVAIIGPTDPTVTGPSNATSRIVQAPADCSPCKHMSRCPTDHRCMRRISTDQVLAAALDLLSCLALNAGERP